MPTYSLWNELSREVRWLRQYIPADPVVVNGEAGEGDFDLGRMTPQEQDELGRILFELLPGDPEVLEAAIGALNFRLACRGADLLILAPVRRAR
jgi:hypothetical protein